MRPIKAELYVRAEGRRVGHDELLADADLRARVDPGGNPLGGLSLSDGVQEVVLDDALGFIAAAFLYEAPSALAAGKSYGYNLRLSHGGLGIKLKEGMATVVDDNSDQLTCPVSDLLAALASARAVYEALVRPPTDAG